MSIAQLARVEPLFRRTTTLTPFSTGRPSHGRRSEVHPCLSVVVKLSRRRDLGIRRLTLTNQVRVLYLTSVKTVLKRRTKSGVFLFSTALNGDFGSVVHTRPRWRIKSEFWRVRNLLIQRDLRTLCLELPKKIPQLTQISTVIHSAEKQGGMGVPLPPKFSEWSQDGDERRIRTHRH
jgi:hypothetical protein